MHKLEALYAVCLAVATLSTLVAASMFLFSKEFFSYHSQASHLKWSDVDGKLQLVILAVMRMAGSAIALLGLMGLSFSVYRVFESSRLLDVAVPTVLTLFWSASFSITFYVFGKTGAGTPWGRSLLSALCSLTCLVIAIWN